MSKILEERVRQKFLRSQILDFVTKYALLPFSDSLEEYSKDHDVSTDTAKAMIAVAISDCIVEDDVVNVLERKAVMSAYMHKDKLALSISSINKKYQRLKEARKNFRFSDDETVDVIMQYTTSPFSKKEFCKKGGITLRLFGTTMKIGISRCLVPDDVVQRLYQKSLSNAFNTSAVKVLYEKLWKAREEYQKLHS